MVAAEVLRNRLGGGVEVVVEKAQRGGASEQQIPGGNDRKARARAWARAEAKADSWRE
jgi:hypothetical protein